NDGDYIGEEAATVAYKTPGSNDGDYIGEEAATVAYKTPGSNDGDYIGEEAAAVAYKTRVTVDKESISEESDNVVFRQSVTNNDAVSTIKTIVTQKPKDNSDISSIDNIISNKVTGDSVSEPMLDGITVQGTSDANNSNTANGGVLSQMSQVNYSDNEPNNILSEMSSISDSKLGGVLPSEVNDMDSVDSSNKQLTTQGVKQRNNILNETIAPSVDVKAVTTLDVDNAVTANTLMATAKSRDQFGASESKQINSNVAGQGAKELDKSSKAVIDNLNDDFSSQEEDLTAQEDRDKLKKKLKNRDIVRQGTAKSGVIKEKTNKPSWIGHPRLSIMIVNLGLNQMATDKALNLKIPLAYGFTPYGFDLGKHSLNSKLKNHDIFISLPLENSNLVDDNPGPYGLRNDHKIKQLEGNLNLILGLIENIRGVYIDGEETFFTSHPQAKLVLESLAERNYLLVYGQNRVSQKMQNLLNSVQISYLSNIYRIDNDLTEHGIMDSLERAEKWAIAGKKPILVARPYPITIRVLQKWYQKVRDSDIRVVLPSQLNSD
ncbi:MAG: divergent polysaccharide deacetylase family protein, partial [Pseudomonadota bacterium]